MNLWNMNVDAMNIVIVAFRFLYEEAKKQSKNFIKGLLCANFFLWHVA